MSESSEILDKIKKDFKEIEKKAEEENNPLTEMEKARYLYLKLLTVLKYDYKSKYTGQKSKQCVVGGFLIGNCINISSWYKELLKSAEISCDTCKTEIKNINDHVDKLNKQESHEFCMFTIGKTPINREGLSYIVDPTFDIKRVQIGANTNYFCQADKVIIDGVSCRASTHGSFENIDKKLYELDPSLEYGKNGKYCDDEWENTAKELFEEAQKNNGDEQLANEEKIKIVLKNINKFFDVKKVDGCEREGAYVILLRKLGFQAMISSEKIHFPEELRTYIMINGQKVWINNDTGKFVFTEDGSNSHTVPNKEI